jgi:hypothetical protein
MTSIHDEGLDSLFDDLVGALPQTEDIRGGVQSAPPMLWSGPGFLPSFLVGDGEAAGGPLHSLGGSGTDLHKLPPLNPPSNSLGLPETEQAKTLLQKASDMVAQSMQQPTPLKPTPIVVGGAGGSKPLKPKIDSRKTKAACLSFFLFTGSGGSVWW